MPVTEPIKDDCDQLKTGCLSNFFHAGYGSHVVLDNVSLLIPATAGTHTGFDSDIVFSAPREKGGSPLGDKNDSRPKPP